MTNTNSNTRIPAIVRKPACFGNKNAKQWDGRQRERKFDLYQNVKVSFDAALRDAKWESVLMLSHELMNFDVRDFSEGEMLFFNTALPRIEYFNDAAITKTREAAAK